MVMGRNECGSNAMVTVQMTVEEYLEMKSRQTWHWNLRMRILSL